MTTGRRKGKTGQLREEKALLEALSRVLSEEELQRVFAGALLELDRAGRKRLIDRLGKDTGATLLQVLEPGPGRRKQQRPGKDKIRREWEYLWSEWNECVLESSFEEGRYVIQDVHWEPPYLDSTTLAEDLESTAVKMRTLLPRVVDEGLDLELSFLAAIEEAAQEIGSGLPEWMEHPEGCWFGPQVTGCLLEWEWRVGQRAGDGPFEIVTGVCRLDSSLDAVLDAETIISFVLGLGELEQQAILEAITEHRNSEPWASVLREPCSCWFVLYQELARRWDTDRFLASCRANIARSWELALPPVKDLLRRKAFEEARSLIEEAVASLLRLAPGETWDPREGLLIQHRSQRCWMDSKATRRQLLESWRRVASGLGQEDVARALKVQAALLTRWEDWDAALRAFHEAEEGSARAGAGSRLFAAWCEEVAEAAVGSTGGWVSGLADGARLGDAAVFHRAVRGWLGQLESTPGGLERSLRSLELLTMLLDPGSKLKRAAPALWRQISTRPEKKGKLARSLRRWTRQLRGQELFPEVLELWKRNAASLVPDPARARGSNYAHCAEWLGVVRDLDRRAYTRILQDWSGRHRRRRNLWQALEESRLLPEDRD